MGYKQCEGLTKKGSRCQNGAMAFSIYCGPHNDQVAGSPKAITLDGFVDLLQMMATSAPVESRVVFARAAQEIVRLRDSNENLRKENKKLRKKYGLPDAIPLTNPKLPSEASP